MPSATPQPTPQAAPTVFTWPVQGDILTDYSLEVLSYNPTMDDWRTHDGLDIASAAGTEVKAAAAGTVTAVLQDAMMGTTVVVEHGGGLTSTYSNLASVPTVAVGDTVGAGSVLGSVGGTAIAESALASHLHFSMSLDGSTVDPWNTCPTKFFPFLSSLICRRRMASAMRRLHCITHVLREKGPVGQHARQLDERVGKSAAAVKPHPGRFQQLARLRRPEGQGHDRPGAPLLPLLKDDAPPRGGRRCGGPPSVQDPGCPAAEAAPAHRFPGENPVRCPTR